MKTRRKNWTMVEMLFVVAIIVILMAMMIPGLEQARGLSYNSRCKNNLRQIGINCADYSNEYNNFIPFDARGFGGCDTKKGCPAGGCTDVSDNPDRHPDSHAYDLTGGATTKAAFEASTGGISGSGSWKERLLLFNKDDSRDTFWQCPLTVARLPWAENRDKKSTYGGTSYCQYNFAGWNYGHSAIDGEGDGTNPGSYGYPNHYMDLPPKYTTVASTSFIAADAGASYISDTWVDMPGFKTNNSVTYGMSKNGTVVTGPYGAWWWDTSRPELYGNGHPGNRANLAMADGSVWSISEDEMESIWYDVQEDKSRMAEDKVACEGYWDWAVYFYGAREPGGRDQARFW